VLQVCSFPVGGGLLALCLPRLKGALFSFLQGKRDEQENHVDLMKGKIDSDTGREMITRRFATVEPVFGNLRGNKRLHRFTLRGKTKVDGQWKLYCMMHNIEKLANHGYAR